MPMTWNKLLNRDRLCQPKNKSLRPKGLNPFFEDKDRIVFSQPFRRLKDKTQVHPLSDNDHVRTRLTHSLEVATIGEALGNLVGNALVDRGSISNQAADIGFIIRSACLAHDIGNPPFGHVGESAIREWFATNKKCHKELSAHQKADLCNFDGNAQGFRLVTELENNKGNGGLQLTYATLAALMKYPWSSIADPTGKGKYGFNESELKYAKVIAEKVGLIEIKPNKKGIKGMNRWCRHPLAYLVEAADDICYSIIDLEDGIQMRVFAFEKYEKFIKEFLEPDNSFKQLWSDYVKLDDQERKIGYLRAMAISCLAEQVTKAFVDHEEIILEGNFKGDLISKTSAATFVETCQKAAQDEVFLHPKKLYLEIASYTVLPGLLEDFSKAAFDFPNTPRKKEDFLIELMGNNRPHKEDTNCEKLRKVVDFISGMTDSYALGMYRQIRGITQAAMTPVPLGKE